jgi:hypothetical protein
MALPCKENCAGYYEGCHKSCPVWEREKQQRKLKALLAKKYLQQHKETCSIIIRQYMAMAQHRSF